MKKTGYLISIILIMGIQSHAQFLVNQGGGIRINSGSALVIQGSFRNETSGSVNNSGNIYITGNWTNNATSGNLLQGSTGTVRFNGGAVQTVGGTRKTWFRNINLQNNIALAFETSVAGTLTHVNKTVTLNNHNLVMESGSSISGANATGYIVASGNGKLVQQVGASNKAFPVGTASAYAPVILNNTGTLDSYGVNVFVDVRANGLTGTSIPELNDCVLMTWNITENVAGGSNLSITPYWNAAIEGANFNRTEAGIGHYVAGNWDAQSPPVTASGSNPYFITRSGITTLSAFAVGDLESPMASPEVPEFLTLQDITIGSGDDECFDATQTITLAGGGTTFVVQDGGSVVLIAGQNIMMLNGTVVQPGGYMHAYITTDNMYCSNPLPIISANFPDKSKVADITDVFENQPMFRVFPNPTTGIFTIEFAEVGITTFAQVEVLGMLGESVLKTIVNGGNQHTIDLSAQPKGLYIIRLSNGQDVGIEKIIKQ